MNNLRERQIEEGKKRLEILNVLGAAQKDFSYGHVWLSEYQNKVLRATLYDIDANACPEDGDESNMYNKIQKYIKDFEGHNNAVVYHVIIDKARWINLLYVSQEESRWKYDKEELKEGRAYVYTISLTPEAGTIGVTPVYGGVHREW